MVHRDLDVFKTVQMEYNIPIAILMGGGNEVRILLIVVTCIWLITIIFLTLLHAYLHSYKKAAVFSAVAMWCRFY